MLLESIRGLGYEQDDFCVRLARIGLLLTAPLTCVTVTERLFGLTDPL
jgi:hypothetical protein